LKYPAEFRPDAQSGFEYHLYMNSRDQDQNTAETRQRKIIHIDMDAFYASVEQRDNPGFTKIKSGHWTPGVAIVAAMTPGSSLCLAAPW
jgi:hypothetical protein